jgi:MoxR-like ATPase
VTVTGSQRVLVLHGLPGMGKTVTAAAFARSTEAAVVPERVLWLSMRESLRPTQRGLRRTAP